jgi:hypothetical protein
MGYKMIEDLQDFDAVGGFSVSINKGLKLLLS